MAKYWGTPHFSPKMTQNGLKWILNTTLVNVTFLPTSLSGVQNIHKKFAVYLSLLKDSEQILSIEKAGVAKRLQEGRFLEWVSQTSMFGVQNVHKNLQFT